MAGKLLDRSDKMPDRQMKDYRITVRFPAELRQRLKTAAHRSGTRQSDLVRAAVERQLAAEDDALTAYEHAKKAGLIGEVKGANQDLSTNPRHFGGFGGTKRASSNCGASGVRC
jgi:predicted DNA-binding protein